MQRVIGNLLVSIIVLTLPGTTSAEKPLYVRDDRGAGVRSEVFLEKDAQPHRQGETDDYGYILLAKGCKQGDIILASPINPLYYKGRKDCSPAAKQLEVRVTKKKFAQNLQSNATRLENARDWAKAALVYNEIAGRVEPVDDLEAQESRQKVYLLFARHLKLGTEINVIVFDLQQEKWVMSPGLARKVEEFQLENGITASGRIDYKTLSTAAGEDVGKYIFDHAVKITDKGLN